MKRRTGRLLATLLAVVLAASCAAALADGWARWPEWTCPTCGMPGNTGNYCPNCAQPRTASAYSSGLEQIPGVSDRLKIRVASVTANSYIVNRQNGSLWIPAHAADGDDSTCWQFSTQSTAFGRAWLSLTFTEPQSVDELWFKAGYWTNGSSGGNEYTMNCRPRDIRVDFEYKDGVPDRDDAEYIQLRDDVNSRDWQRVRISRRDEVTEVRIWVLSAYTGSRFPNDVCLSEVMAVQVAGGSSARQNSGSQGQPQPVKVTEKPQPVKVTEKPQPVKVTEKPQPAKVTAKPQPQPVQTGKGSKTTAKPQPQPVQGGTYAGIPSADNAPLLNSLATRSGPSNEYDEPGTFFKDNWQSTTVRVLGKAWDGSAWWVQVDFAVKGTRYRVWTGMKRLSVNMDAVPEVQAAGSGRVTASESRRGPGGDYARGPVISGRRDVTAYGRENGYVEVEYTEGSVRYRVWVPEACARISWY